MPVRSPAPPPQATGCSREAPAESGSTHPEPPHSSEDSSERTRVHRAYESAAPNESEAHPHCHPTSERQKRQSAHASRPPQDSAPAPDGHRCSTGPHPLAGRGTVGNDHPADAHTRHPDAPPKYTPQTHAPAGYKNPAHSPHADKYLWQYWREYPAK